MAAMDKKAKRGSKGHIKWDEENLMICESQKSATMKIDEPDTPFNKYNMEEDEEVQEALREEKETPSIASLAAELAKEEEKEKSTENSGVGCGSGENDSEEEEEEDSEEARAKKEAFEKKRKAHYNEWEMIQKARAMDDADED